VPSLRVGRVVASAWPLAPTGIDHDDDGQEGEEHGEHEHGEITGHGRIMDPDVVAAILGGITLCVGVVGAVRAGAHLTRGDLAQTVEVQHTIWEETHAQLADCRDEVARLRDP
jgi:hypothetical protein